jgi:Holliday junction resolvase RusA-like endonuclease
MEYEFLLTPIGKPRMTQRDKWLNPPRKAVTKYRLAKQGIQFYACEQKFILPEIINVTFVLPVTLSWSKKKKQAMLGQPHRQKPDLDNILKFLLDSLLPEGGDEVVHTIVAKKIWGEEGRIIIITDDNESSQN